MKHAELRSIAHNLADSLSSGIGLLVGHYDMDVYGEAARSSVGAITVDFLSGRVLEGEVSSSLHLAIKAYSKAVDALTQSQGGSRADFEELVVRFWSDWIKNRFSITVRDKRGRKTTAEYAGRPGKRVRLLDPLGRLRPMPPMEDQSCASAT